MRKLLFVAMAAIIGFTACQKENTDTGKKGITVIRASAPSLTRIAVDPGTGISGADAVTWKDSDKIKLFQIEQKQEGDADYGGGGYRVIPVSKAPALVFNLINGEGSSEAEFRAEGDGLDPTKKYIACHVSRDIIADVTAIKAVDYDVTWSTIITFYYGGTNASVSNAEELENYSAERLHFYAMVELDDQQNVVPLEFQPLTPIIEFRISQDELVAGDWVVNSIMMTKIDGLNSNGLVNGSYAYFDLNENFEPVYRLVNAYSYLAMTTKHKPALPKGPNDPLVIRMAWGWNQTAGGNGEGWQKFKVDLSLSPANDLETKLTHTKTITRNVDPGVNAFKAGSTYIKEFVVSSAPV